MQSSDITGDSEILFDDATYAFYEVLPQAERTTRGDRFKVILFTEQYAPSHTVTLRNNIDGWTKDIYGNYAFGGWIFELERSNYPGQLEIKFVLDKQFWMEGFNRVIGNNNNHNFRDNSANVPGIINDPVVFPGNIPSRFLHGYENLHLDDDPFTQKRFPGNRNESVLYDVIVIGSGMGGRHCC